MVESTRYIGQVILASLLLVLGAPSQAQVVSAVKEGEGYALYRIDELSTGLHSLALPAKLTSLVVEIPVDQSFAGSYLLLNPKDTIWLGEEIGDYAQARLASQRTPLVIMPAPTATITLYSHMLSELKVHAMFSGDSDEYLRRLNRMAADEPCEAPPFILPREWREGLPEPKLGRIKTQVEHIVVHHSASNLSGNYVNDVRNIYLYHTQTNGWDDIGYNFLVAPDGTVFLGRDPEGHAPDEVQGAHFCAKNSGTMGVCLMGNYAADEPTDTALEVLAKLCTWKMKREGSFPFEKAQHPLNSSKSIDLSRIAGHRDGHKKGVWNGCATECPGQEVYEQLHALRQRVEDMLAECGIFSHFPDGYLEVEEANITVYPQPASDVIKISGLNQIMGSPNILDINGRACKIIQKSVASGLSFDVSLLPAGSYVLIIPMKNQIRRLRFIKA